MILEFGKTSTTRNATANLEQRVDVLVHTVSIGPIVLHFPNVLRLSKLI